MDFIKQVIKEYAIEQVPMVVLRETMYNSVYLVGIENKKILRVGHRVSSDDVNFEFEILNKLHSSGVPVAKWNKTTEGHYFVNKDNHIAVMFDYVDGYHPILNKLTRPDLAECYCAGETLAKIHGATGNYLPKYSRTRTVFSELERVMKYRDQFNSYEGGKEFVEQVEHALMFGRLYEGNNALVHNDYRVDNLFFKNKKEISAVIDFDWSCIGPIIKDLAHSVLVWSFADGGTCPDEKVIKSFMDGYNSISNVRIFYDNDFINWIQFSALADASTYFCDRLTESGFEKRINRSYMYKKFLYFKNNK